jgi:phosphotransferase system  glucose/maltose/N-acetylglucosamine-specific IIC component
MGDEIPLCKDSINDTIQKMDSAQLKGIKDMLAWGYETEWQRTRSIQNKATNTIGFLGIIYSLIIGTLTNVILSIDENAKVKILLSSSFTPIFLTLLLLLILVAIYYGVKAYSIIKWHFPYTDNIYYNYKNGFYDSDNEMFHEFLHELEIGTGKNRENNRAIAKFLKRSIDIFYIGLIFVFVYFILFLYIIFEGGII